MPPATPFITTDQAAIGFDQIFGSGTFIGTTPQASLAITNAGLADLHITAITKSGDGAFTIMDETDPPTITVPGEKSTFVEIFFAPTQPIEYTGAITIVSDATNNPDGGLVIGLSGLGVRPPSNCNEPDGGLMQGTLPDGGCLLPDGGM